MLAEETERGLEDTQKRLTRRESELAAQEERCARLEDRIGELQRGMAQSTDENTDIRRTVSQLDREKDHLQINVDEKTEKVANLNEEVLLKVLLMLLMIPVIPCRIMIDWSHLLLLGNNVFPILFSIQDVTLAIQMGMNRC